MPEPPRETNAEDSERRSVNDILLQIYKDTRKLRLVRSDCFEQVVPQFRSGVYGKIWEGLYIRDARNIDVLYSAIYRYAAEELPGELLEEFLSPPQGQAEEKDTA